MKKIVLLLLVLVTVFFGYAIFHNSQKKNVKESPVEIAEEETVEQDGEDNGETLLEIPSKNLLPDTLDPEIFLVVHPNMKAVKVGEPFILTYKLYSLLDVESVNNIESPDFTYFYSRRIDLTDNYYKEERYNGKNYKTLVLFRYGFIPLQTGEFEIGRMKLDLKLKEKKTKSNNRSVFDDFFENYEIIEKVIYSPKFAINVIPGSTSETVQKPVVTPSQGNGSDIFLVMDISSSMLAQDFKPDRMNVTKTFAKNFIKDHPDDKIGLIQFAGEAEELSNLTSDHNSLNKLINAIDTGKMKDGTAIGDALILAIKKLHDEGGSKKIVLLTDGRNNSGSISPFTAAEIAKLYGVKIYSVGICSNDSLVPYPIMTAIGAHTVNIPMEIDDFGLQHISLITGGNYFRVTDEEELNSVSLKSNTRLIEEKKKQKRFYPENKMSEEMISKVLNSSFKKVDADKKEEDLVGTTSDSKPESKTDPVAEPVSQGSGFVAKAPEIVSLGTQFRIIYTLNMESSKDNVKSFDLGKINGFNIIMGPSMSTSSSTSIIKGVTSTTTSRTYTYMLSPEKEGNYTIPPATIIVNGKKYNSNSLRIKVTKN